MKDTFDLDKLKKPKRKNSRRKGNNFENDVAKIFNERFGTTEFSRSPGSGAFGTIHKLPEYMRVYGDLITPRNFRFTIEAKCGYNEKLLIADLFDENSLFYKFIKKAEEDSLKATKEKINYVLVIKQSRKDILIFTPDSGTDLDKKFRPVNTMYIQTKNYSLFGMPLKEFLSVYESGYFYLPEST